MENIRNYLDYDGLEEYHRLLMLKMEKQMEEIESKIPQLSYDDTNEALVIKGMSVYFNDTTKDLIIN